MPKRKQPKLKVAFASDGHIRISYRGRTIGSFTRQDDNSMVAVVVPRHLSYLIWRDERGEYHDLPSPKLLTGDEL